MTPPRLPFAMNARRACLASFLLIAALVFAASASAHHSPVAFDTDITDFTIVGEIQSVDVRNPHSVMDLRVTNDDGSQTLWHIEFSSVNLLLRRGWDFERLRVGERVACTGNPSASGKREMYMWSISLEDGTEFGR
jgi:hypothetical protein